MPWWAVESLVTEAPTQGHSDVRVTIRFPETSNTTIGLRTNTTMMLVCVPIAEDGLVD